MLSNSIDKYISENIGQNLDELKNRDLSAWMEYKSMNCGKLISEKYDLEDLYMYIKRAAAAAKSLQSCPTLCDPIDGSPPGSPVPGSLQARTLEWVVISFSNAWKWKVKVKSLSRVQLSATPWTAAHQAPPSMGFSRLDAGVSCHCLLSDELYGTLFTS